MDPRLRRELMWLLLGVILLAAAIAAPSVVAVPGWIHGTGLLVGFGLVLRGVFRSLAEVIRLLTGRDFIFRR